MGDLIRADFKTKKWAVVPKTNAVVASAPLSDTVFIPVVAVPTLFIAGDFMMPGGTTIVAGPFGPGKGNGDGKEKG